MTYNFEFLKKEEKYDSFTYACIESEKSLVVSYATTAILTRRALELAIKWVFSYDEDLSAPYQDNLATLIHDFNFKNIIDVKLFPMMTYIQKLGNKAVHSSSNISKEQAILSLRNLYEFISWIDYCYSEELHEVDFDENILGDNEQKKKTRQELKDLYEKLGSKDRKLEEVIKENEILRKENASKREKNKQDREFLIDEISEFKTRKMYIDLELELNGWVIGNDCIEEVELQGMPNSSNIGYADYVLYDDDGKLLAVIEAKKTSIDPKMGQVQVQRYADCLEKLHGIRPIMFYTNGFDYYLWDDMSYPERIVSGIYTKEKLQWLMYKRIHKASLLNPEIKDEISNRHYQKMAINAVCDTLNKGNRKSLLVMATGSGKTRVAISIVDVLINKGWVKNALFLADRTALVKQAKKNFKALLPELSLCNLLDSKDNPESRMVFSTYPTMMNVIDDLKNKNGKESKMIKSLTENIINIKCGIIKELQHIDYQTDEYINHRKELIQDIIKEVKSIDETKLNAHMKIKFIHKFNQYNAYENLNDTDIRELEEQIAPLISAIDDDELAKRFDYLMYTIEYADLKGLSASKPKNRVVTTAEKLSYKGSIEHVKKKEQLINIVQTNEYWEQANIFDHEMVRVAFRDLIKFLDNQSGEIYYTNFTDEIIESKENEGDYSVNDMQSYKKKVNKYLMEHQDDLIVYKLKNNKPLTGNDIKHLEKILWHDLGTKEDYKKEFGEEPLLKLVSKIVGLDPKATNEIFSDFLSDENLNINQMEFVKLIVNYIIKNGSMDKKILNEHPFNKCGNVVKLFDGKINIAKKIISVIDKINERLSI